MANVVRKYYDFLSGFPGGKRLFSRIIGWVAPYTGTIGMRVTEVHHGYARIEMRDGRRVRNHLKSIHAMALMNLAEITSGIAFMYAVPENARSILKGISIEYLKKGRGTLHGECSFMPPEVVEGRSEHYLDIDIKNTAGEMVARARAHWLLGLEK